MAREKLTTEIIDVPDVVPDVVPEQPMLSPQTLAEQELGRKQAAINAAAMERALKAREEEANK